jgi:predicted membrane channel-forming protein YqfA (hemolysin III family)
VLHEFWVTAPTSYKILVFTAMGLIAVGLVLTVAGNAAGNPGLMTAALPVIGLGLVLHIVGLVVRGQSVRKNIRK